MTEPLTIRRPPPFGWAPPPPLPLEHVAAWLVCALGEGSPPVPADAVTGWRVWRVGRVEDQPIVAGLSLNVWRRRLPTPFPPLAAKVVLFARALPLRPADAVAVMLRGLQPYSSALTEPGAGWTVKCNAHRLEAVEYFAATSHPPGDYVVGRVALWGRVAPTHSTGGLPADAGAEVRARLMRHAVGSRGDYGYPLSFENTLDENGVVTSRGELLADLTEQYALPLAEAPPLGEGGGVTCAPPSSSETTLAV